MPTINKEFYSVSVTMLIDKKMFDNEIGDVVDDKKKINEVVADRIQCGIEIPIEKIDVEITS